MSRKIPFDTTMRRVIALLILGAVAGVFLACQSTPTPVPPTASGNTYSPFTDGSFSLELPAWPQGEPPDEQTLHIVSDGSATVWVKTWPLIPRLTAESVCHWVDEAEAATLIGEETEADRAKLEFTLSDGPNTMRLRSHYLYCDAHTYEVTVVAEASAFGGMAPVFDHVLASAKCAPPQRLPHLESGALGMVILPPASESGDFDPAAYQQALLLARNNGVQVSHYYFAWGDIETAPGVYDWTVPDYIVEAHQLEGFELSVVIEVIHTTVRGRIPADLADLPFDDPRFTERLSTFLTTFADRYAGRVHYLSVGNEVNDYFATNRDELPAYAAAFDQARAAVHARHPDLPMGIVFAYHDAEEQGTLDAITALNRGDFVAYTLYLHEGFHFTRDPAEVGEWLDRMLNVAGETPVVIVETGWSTAPELDGSEEAQAEYVRQVFAALSERRDRVRFLSWFVLHDSRRETCHDLALTFFPPGTEVDTATMEAFVSFLCHFGLRRADGTPKLAWEVWVEEAGRW